MSRAQWPLVAFALLVSQGTWLAPTVFAEEPEVVVQTAVNGTYDSQAQTLVLNQVDSVRPGRGGSWSTVRNQALTKSFATVFASAAGSPIATLVAHDAAGDGRRSHHLVRVSSPSYLPWSNTVTYKVEVLNPQSPLPAKLDRVFLLLTPGLVEAITDPQPLAEIAEDLAAAELREAFSAQTATAGRYDPATNLLSLRGVQHSLLVDRPFVTATRVGAAELAPELEEAYSKIASKPVAVLSLPGSGGGQQVVLRLEDVDYDASSDELRYAVTALESSAPLPSRFGAATLGMAPAIFFGRGWPAHSVCCDCDVKCSVLWVAIAYCKTCVSPLGGDKCCKTCRRPASPGGSCA